TELGRGTVVTATFSSDMDASTITTSTFTLAAGDGIPLPATVAYNAPSRTATLTPTSPLALNATAYTAQIAASVRATDGATLGTPVVWTFTTSSCPCRLIGPGLTPAATGISTLNGRNPAGGPYTLEVGVKIQVTQPMVVEALRFWKDAAETGAHVGRIWSSTGTLLKTVQFMNETASGWQRQALGTPFPLQANTTYTI